MDFILNDETVVNSHGFMLMNAGGRFDRFNSNPVMLYGHKDDFVLGSWDELNVKGKQILASPKFDSDDADAAKIEGKVERGFIKGASVGIMIHAAELKKIGEEYVPAVTDWTLLEASIVSIPSNQSALSLMIYDEKGKQLTPEQVKLNLSALTNNNQINNDEMNGIVLTAEAYTKLGLDSKADSAALSAEIVKLSERAEKAEKEISDIRKSAAETLVAKAIDEGRLTADKKDSFVALAMNDYKHTAEVISAIPAKKNLSGSLNETQAAFPDDMPGIPEDRKGWNYLKYIREDAKGFSKLRKEHPETAAKLKAQYGK